MKQLAEAAQAVRHRRWHWCRRRNGFSDMPIWRVVAAQLNMPLYQVLAFINRLEEFANSAEQRGHVGDFRAGEFGAALGMTSDEAARIFAALEHPDIGWIVFDHVADFIPRNPDRDDDADAARERKARQRSRDRGMKEIARRFARGEIDANQRRALEAELLLDARLSTRLTGHNVTPRDIVTVTPEQTTDFQVAAVDNSGDIARGATEGQPRQISAQGGAELEQATRWLEGEGKRLVIERVGWTALQADTHMERWRRDLQDDRVLARIIQGVAVFNFRAATFHIFISDQVAKAVLAAGQQQLPLPPTQSVPGTKRGVA